MIKHKTAIEKKSASSQIANAEKAKSIGLTTIRKSQNPESLKLRENRKAAGLKPARAGQTVFAGQILQTVLVHKIACRCKRSQIKMASKLFHNLEII